jgi:rRNA maturation endonuclease Nob1
MRVHRECHECKKDFGGENVCGNCGHKRCKECTRFPKKVDKDEDATINVVIEKPEKYRLQITKPARASKQDLVLKKPVQRVRRNCHCCGTLFYPPTKTCTECGHIRCTDCPRDPPKLRKYPYGYPNDVFGDKTAYYTCHECEKVFPLDEAKCANCTHEKCTECARAPPRKVEAQPDPEVLRRVEERLAQLALTSAAAES